MIEWKRNAASWLLKCERGIVRRPMEQSVLLTISGVAIGWVLRGHFGSSSNFVDELRLQLPLYL